MAKNEARDVPAVWRVYVADRINAWIAEHAADKTTRAIADEVGMKQPTLVQLKNKKGSFGLHILVQVRAAFGISIDEMLDLPVTTRAATKGAQRLPAAAVSLALQNDDLVPKLVPTTPRKPTRRRDD